MTCRLRMGSQVAVMVLVFAWPRAARPQSSGSASAAKVSNAGEQVVISIGDQKLTAAKVENIIGALPPQSRAFYGGQGKKFLPQYLVQMTVLSDEAEKHHLQSELQVQEAIKIARQAILANAERERIEKSMPVTEQQIQEIYQKQKTDYEEVRIRRILIRTDTSPIPFPASPSRPPLPEAEARKKLEALRKQAQAGADFAQLAQENSDDLTTAGAGGDLGYINRLKVVPPIADAAYALELGKVSDVIRTPYGLELIKIEGRRVKPFADVRQELEAQFRKAEADQAIQQLIGQYKVVVDKEYFSPRPQPKAAASPTPP